LADKSLWLLLLSNAERGKHEKQPNNNRSEYICPVLFEGRSGRNFDQREADMLCRWCGTDMPDGSRFCLKCGQKTDVAAIKALAAATPSQLSCVTCGASLPPTAAFCLKCGKPAPSTGNLEALATVLAECMAFLRARRQRRILVWAFVLVLLGAVLWAVTGESPAAQEVQEFVHWSQAQTVVDASVSVNPRSFSSHEFTVPPGALDVTVTGEFSASPVGPRHGKGNGNESGKDADNGIEAYVLTNPAFAVWSTGYSTATIYQSNSTTGAVIDASLPGAGVYDLVFSNRTSPYPKTVHATLLLRYKSGWPNAILRLKERLWNLIGL
jgi:ribosomal protein L40E